MDEIPVPVSPIAYATPAPYTGSSVAAGVWISIAGLGLIFLGGCFCIGIMISLNIGNATIGFGNPTPTSPGGGLGTTLFITVLYILAFACFAAAVLVLVLGIRKLLAIGRS